MKLGKLLRKRCLIFLIGCIVSMPLLAEEALHPIFSSHEKNLLAWEEVRFNASTEYVLKNEGQMSFIHANSIAAASGLIKKEQVDLRRTPILNWRWRVIKPLPEQPEITKVGDDYAARLYVVFSDGWFFWQTKAINYVWSSREVVGEFWQNAYAPENARMIALRGPSHAQGEWYTEKRNVQADIQAWLGKEIDLIDAVAIMVDTDDSQAHAIAEIAHIYFSSY